MAKTKKQVLSLDERLKQALVPESEQPYSIPENWVFSYFTSLIDVQGGTQPPKSTFVNLPQEGYVRLVQIRDFASEKYKVYIPDKKNLRKFDDSDILIARYGASLGRICTGLSGAYNVALAKTIFSRQALFPRFVYWLLQSECFQLPLMQLSRTAQAGFNKDDLSYFAIPLPPLAEQQRIVTQIESLFQKLDSARDLVQNALDSFETRKAAILYKAFTGELTANWRVQNDVSRDTWEEKRFDKVAEIKSNLVDPSSYQDLPHIAPDNIEKRTGILLPYKTIREDGVKSGKHRFYAGQILYSKIRPYLSKVVLIDFDGLCSADMYPIEAKGDTKYLWYYMLSDEFLEQASNAGSRSVLPKINQKELSSLRVRVPSLPEQKEIVRILDSLLENEQKAKDLCDILDKIDLMKKAILARAFRGELGTNDPNDESAVELLKEVLAETENK